MPLTREELRALILKISEDDDQWAFRKFFEYYHPRLLHFAYFYLESEQASDEIASIVFEGIWNNRKKLPLIERIEAYLFNSVKYKCLNYLRDNRRIHFQDLNSNEVYLVKEVEDPEGQVLHKEFRMKIMESIEQLPPRCKMIFQLVREEGLKYKEVAELLEISVKTVEVQMGKALSRIRNDIRPYVESKDANIYLKRHFGKDNLLSLFNFF